VNLADALNENAALKQLVAHLLVKIEGLEQAYAALKADHEALRERLTLNSQTSSLPPSSDGSNKPPPRERPPSARKRGGQPGHRGSTLRKCERPDDVVDLKPTHCHTCQGTLDPDLTLGQPAARQVFDLPPDLRLRVTQYQVSTLVCPHCQQRNRAAFPAGVVSGTQYGSRIKGLMAYLNHEHEMPYSRSARMLRDIFSGTVCAATLVNTTRELDAALAPGQAEREAQLETAPVSHADETGLRVAGKLYWAHVHCAEHAAQLYLSVHRGRKAMGHLARKQGVVVHDGLASYDNFGAYDHGLCNAHHLRELEFMHRARGHEWAQHLQNLLLEALHDTQRARAEGQSTLDPEVVEAYSARFLATVQAAAARQPAPQARSRGRPRRSKELNLLRRLERGMDAVWRFASDFRVPFTNNLAERCLRMLKVKMKVSGCFRTEAGASSHLAIRSALLTAKARQQNLLGLLQNSYQDWRQRPAMG